MSCRLCIQRWSRPGQINSGHKGAGEAMAQGPLTGITVWVCHQRRRALNCRCGVCHRPLATGKDLTAWAAAWGSRRQPMSIGALGSGAARLWYLRQRATSWDLQSETSDGGAFRSLRLFLELVALTNEKSLEWATAGHLAC